MADSVTALNQLRRLARHQSMPLPNVDQLSRQLGHCFRDRLFTPSFTLYLFCLQILDLNCAVNKLRQWSGLNFSSSSYCDARVRLPLLLLQRLLELLAAQIRQLPSTLLPQWTCPRRLIVLDAVSYSTPDTPDLVKHLGLPPNGKPGVSYPTGKLMAVLDLATGMFLRMLAVGPLFHDLRGGLQVHQDLEKGDILVADTAFCSFAHLALLRARGIDGVFRLHQRRPKRAGLQTWKLGKQPDWMSPAQFDALPGQLKVRVVRVNLSRQGCRSQVIYVVTTLLDEQAWPDERIAWIYHLRWRVETCFDHLKTSMNMHVLKCQTMAGVLKELAVYLIIYNLVCGLMLQAALRQKVEPQRISFVDALRRLQMCWLGLPGVEKLAVNPQRKERHNPRTRRRRPKNYRLMTTPREKSKAANLEVRGA